MKVISLLQPWATLVVMGAKKIETRSWNTKYRGELLIHASVNSKMAKELVSTEPFRNFIRHWTDLPFGAIIGKVNLVDTCDTLTINAFPRWGYGKESAELTDQERAVGDYSDNRYGWLLSEPVQLKNPIPAKGSLGIWNYDLPRFEM